MYLKNIKIENYGSIKNFNYKFRFNESGNPVPLVLIGKNGSGKSLVLTNIVDSLIEIKRKIYPDFIPEVKQNKYYKMGKTNYININAEYSNVNITYNNSNNDNTTYVDIMSRLPENTLKNNPLLFPNHNTSSFIKSRYFRTVDGLLEEAEFKQNCFLYFPVDRYYIPNWFNKENYSKIDYDNQNKFVRQSSQNIIKIDVLANIRSWLRDVFISRAQIITKVSNNVFKLMPIPQILDDMILKIIRIIKDDETIDIPKLSYKVDVIPISGTELNVPDINNLSSGEAMILSIFLSIIKEYDLLHENFSFENISGICIIDEIDLNLHISQQKDILPRLIKLFPKMQFIITTHSPFFVSGMSELFLDDCDFINMPDGIKIDNVLEFSEIEKTIEVFNNDTSKYIEKLKNQIASLSKESEKIVILTEGKTDARFIEKAYQKLNKDMSNIKIIGLDDVIHKKSGDQALKSIVNDYKITGGKLIAIFDRDNDTILNYLRDEFNEDGIAPNSKICAFPLPIPKHRNDDDKISIEHYFTDIELNTKDNDGRKMFQAKEFNVNGISPDGLLQCPHLRMQNKIDELHILSGSGNQIVTKFNDTANIALSKNQFCEYICTDAENFDAFDFSNFEILIDKIQKCIDLINSNQLMQI